MTRNALLLLVVLPFSACSSDQAKSGGPSPSDAGPGMFGAECAGNDQCDSGVCFQFGNGAELCTVACSDAADCPSGSQGQKCNNMGYCAP